MAGGHRDHFFSFCGTRVATPGGGGAGTGAGAAAAHSSGVVEVSQVLRWSKEVPRRDWRLWPRSLRAGDICVWLDDTPPTQERGEGTSRADNVTLHACIVIICGNIDPPGRRLFKIGSVT